MKKSLLVLCALCTSAIAFGQLKITPNGVFKTNNNLSGSTGTTGNSSVSFGFGALANNSSNMNTAIGYQALYSNTTGGYNTANGYQALRYNTTSSFNTAVGHSALQNSTSSFNTAVGSLALSANTTGNSNTAIGSSALSANITGSSNTAIGNSALRSNTGSNNTAIGNNALYVNTTGGGNTANGNYVLFSNITGNENTAMGNCALRYNTDGNYNTANGYYALNSNTTGSFNTAIGNSALSANMTGIFNTAIGGSALSANTTGHYNTAIGYNAGVNANNLTNATAIGYNAKVDSSNKVIIGNTSVTRIGGYAGWTTYPSDGQAKKNIQTNVPGLAFINALRPVTYNLNLDVVDDLLKSDDPKINAFQDSLRAAQTPEEQKMIAEAKASKEKIVYTGFIAQDVEKTAKSIGYDFSGIDAPGNGKGTYGLRYAEFVVPLVKAVQELSEQVNELKAEIAELKSAPQLRSAEVIIDESVNNGTVAERSRSTEQQAKLYQNMPNPFNQSTQIKFYVPEKVSTALLCIYDLQGKQLKQTVITQRGHGVETVYASEFTAGIYLYALIAEGNQVDVKKMVLTE